MCNRYALSKKQERFILQDYERLDLYFMERFNIAPTQSAPRLNMVASFDVEFDRKTFRIFFGSSMFWGTAAHDKTVTPR